MATGGTPCLTATLIALILAPEEAKTASFMFVIVEGIPIISSAFVNAVRVGRVVAVIPALNVISLIPEPLANGLVPVSKFTVGILRTSTRLAQLPAKFCAK